MKKISFNKNDMAVSTGLSKKLKVAAVAVSLAAMTTMGACSEDDEPSSCTDVDTGVTADAVGNGDNC